MGRSSYVAHVLCIGFPAGYCRNRAGKVDPYPDELPSPVFPLATSSGFGCTTGMLRGEPGKGDDVSVSWVRVTVLVMLREGRTVRKEQVKGEMEVV